MRQAQFLQFDLPCTDPERRDDWFIPARDPLAPDEEKEIRQTVWKDAAGSADPDAIEKAADKAVADRIAELKSKRRKAIQSCHFDCPMKARLLCLDEGLKPINLEHGVWGGYPETERRDIATAIRNRKKGISTGRAAQIIISAEKKEALDAKSDQD